MRLAWLVPRVKRMLGRRGVAGTRDARRLVAGLLEMAQELTGADSLDERLTHLCRTAVALLGCDRSSLFLLQEGYYRARFNHGNPPDIARVFHLHRVRPDDPLIRRAVESRSFVMLNDASGSALMDPRTARAARIRSIVVAPLLEPDGAPSGFLTAEFNERRGRFSELDSSLLLGIAKLAEAALHLDRAESERARAQARAAELAGRVRDLERLEALGRLSGGVAHDLNNILTVVLGHYELLSKELEAGAEARESLEQIRIAAERAAGMARQLLAFGRRQIRAPRNLDLDRLVRGMLPMLRRLIAEDIEIWIHSTADRGLVRADPGQLEQVVLNLVLNARDAMPRGGRLTLETANAELDEAYARTHPGARAGRYVMLAVADTGQGIPPEHLPRVFDPFFTTKHPGHGTGLGLATVYGIVKQNGGNVWAYSEAGRGTTFKVYLPRVEGAAAEEEPLEARTQTRLSGDETILIADDDAEVRRLARAGLEAQGYAVLEGADARTALEISRTHTGPIDLIVTDVVMPGRSGRALAEAIHRERPETRVLFMSGYAENSIVHHGVLEAGVWFLAKPFTPSALCRRVREVIDHDPEPAASGP